MVLAGDGTFTKTPGQKTAKRWAMVIFTRKKASPALQKKVSEACHSYHNVPKIEGPQEVKWIWSDTYKATFTEDASNFPAKSLTERSFLMLCNHCENPACVRVCPTKATFQRENGIVVMDYHRCIGCPLLYGGLPLRRAQFQLQNPAAVCLRREPGVPHAHARRGRKMHFLLGASR
jgi:molybdopterin-containing oxidoreductase family iron-sulfur binding subunit